MRIAFVAAFGFTIGAARGQTLPFLAPLLAVQLVVMSRTPPKALQGLAFPVLVAVACGIALVIAELLIDRPVPFVLVVALVLFFAFLLDAQRRAGPFPLVLLVMTVSLPVFASQSLAVAQGLAEILFVASFEAVLLVWAAHAIFPAAPDADMPSQPAAPRDSHPERRAFGNTLILLPLFVSYLLQGDELSIVVLITTIMMLRQPAAAGPRAALGLLLGNLVGGIAALIAFHSVTMLPSLAFLLLLTLLVGLVLAGRIATAGAAAPIHVVALTTFLILLGIGLAPLQSGSGAAFVARLADVLLAVLYAAGAMSLLRPAPSGRPAPAMSDGPQRFTPGAVG